MDCNCSEKKHDHIEDGAHEITTIVQEDLH